MYSVKDMNTYKRTNKELADIYRDTVLRSDNYNRSYKSTVYEYKDLANYKEFIYKASQSNNVDQTNSGQSTDIDQTNSGQSTNICQTNISSPCVIDVVNEDTLTLTHNLIKQGYNPLVLNMASWANPGGGVIGGARAQEEELFRRSNYHTTLVKNYYPLNQTTIVLSPQVAIFKDEEYKLLKHPFYVDMLAVAAIEKPTTDSDGRFKKHEYNLMYDKIKSIFKIAIINGNDSLVLSALGCGAYENPPLDVAEIFKKCIDRYKHNFRGIFFGILGEPNYSVFNKIIKA